MSCSFPLFSSFFLHVQKKIKECFLTNCLFFVLLSALLSGWCWCLTDSAVAYSMQRVDLCLVGAEGVVESGGVVNMLGTYQLAIVAKACKTPLYVATETFKFARLYPLSQNDLPQRFMHVNLDLEEDDVADNAMSCEAAVCDYTPPEYITLMFTDVGVLTPSAVSDELIKLYT